MDDSHAMSLEQIRALVAANSVMRFAGQRRQEVYEWVERTLVRPPVRRPAEARQGRSPTLSGADDRFETSSGDAPDHRVSADRSSDRSALPTGTFSQHLHRSRCGTVVLRGPGARELERTSHATNPGA